MEIKLELVLEKLERLKSNTAMCFFVYIIFKSLLIIILGDYNEAKKMEDY